MWEMGNRILSKLRSPSPLSDTTSTVTSTSTMYPTLSQSMPPQQYVYDVHPNHISPPPKFPPIQDGRYIGYNHHDVNQYYLDDMLGTQYVNTQPPSYLPSSPFPSQNDEVGAPIPSSSIPSSSIPKSPIPTQSPKTRAPRKPKTPVSKSTATIFDTCQDASYTRPSGVQWPEPEWIPATPYKNKMIYAKVVDVYDGDTITIIIMYGDAPMKLKVRLQGVDAPELVVKREKGRVYTPEEESLMELEMKAGAHVRDKVKKLIDQKEVIVKLIKCDKYGGRQVGTVYLKPQSYETLTEYLLSKRYGKPYQAQKKDDWTREELNYILSN